MKKILAIWALCLLLSSVLLFTIANAITATVWISFAFIIIAFITVLLLWLYATRDAKTTGEQFLRLPSLTVSLVYLGIQLPTAVIFAFGATTFSYRITILVHTLILVAAWITIIGGMVGNSHIEQVNSRQKNHHKEL